MSVAEARRAAVRGLGALFRSEHPPIVSFAGAAVVIAAAVLALTRSKGVSAP